MLKSVSILKKEQHYCYVMFSNEDFEFLNSKLYRIDNIDYELKEYFGK